MFITCLSLFSLLPWHGQAVHSAGAAPACPLHSLQNPHSALGPNINEPPCCCCCHRPGTGKNLKLQSLLWSRKDLQDIIQWTLTLLLLCLQPAGVRAVVSGCLQRRTAALPAGGLGSPSPSASLVEDILLSYKFESGFFYFLESLSFKIIIKIEIVSGYLFKKNHFAGLQGRLGGL